MKVSVVMPCLNEAETVGTCIGTAKEALKKLQLEGEVIVVDNGSTDGSTEIARKHGAMVVHEPREGYGNAYLRGFQEAGGEIIVMGDADGTYPFELIPEFVMPILNGKADFVIGSRLRGRILPGAMPWLHRCIGNPLLTKTLNLLFGSNVSDAHCGMRALKRDALEKLRLKTSGMEFASEMVIKAAKNGLRITEIPITYYPRKSGKPKLHSTIDGWRHLRFMFLYKPAALFLVPGVFAFIAGFGMLLLLTTRFHSMILGSLLMIVGFQTITLGLYAKVYAAVYGMDKPDRITRFFFKYNSLEYEMLAGGIIFLAGTSIGLKILMTWIRVGFGQLFEIRNAVLSSTFAIIDIQMIFAALFLSVLLLGKKEE
jgi:glycosyltransferase involved in cell wall biosynthesis